VARLEKAALWKKARKKDNISIFKNECKKRQGRLARLAGRLVLCSLLAVSPVAAGQQASGQPKQEAKTAEAAVSLFPTLERVASFNEPGKEKAYEADVVKVMRRTSSFVQRNSANRAFMLIAEAVMNEALNIQPENGIYYFIDACDSSMTITDRPKNWKKRITMKQAGDGVEISVETEGEPKLSLMLDKDSSPSMDDVIGLRYRLNLLFEDIIGTALILGAAGSEPAP
jgi:hypothetical protein